MARRTDDDFLGLIQDIHGDDRDLREATVDSAVQVIEQNALKAYGALRQLTTRGRAGAPLPVEDPPDESAVPDVEEPAQDVEITAITYADIVVEPPEPARDPAPGTVISGIGADFFDPHRTETHIIRRPKSRPKG